jgi:hypothetical protein
MAIVENTANRLVLKSGSTTLTLDRNTSTVILQRKIAFWGLKPHEAALAQISEVNADKAVDRASGVEIWHTVLVMVGGEAWTFPATSEKDSLDNATAIRQFLAQARS